MTTLVDESRASRAAQRSAGSIASAVGGAAALATATFIPAVHAALGFGPNVAWPAMSVTIVLTGLATVFYYRLGERSRAYQVTTRFEGLAYMLVPLVLVYFSGRGESVLWFTYLSYAALNGRATENFRGILGVTVTGPLLLALAFLVLRQDGVAAGFTLFACFGATSLLLIVRKTSLRLAEVVRERERLRDALSHVRIREERSRIARDLHDGIGADLSALAWRAQRIRADVADPALASEMGTLIERATQGIDDLRSVVWAMRAPVKTWSELVSYVRRRAEELCEGRGTLELVATDPLLDRPLRGELGLHLIRMVQEAVRNAVRHGKPTRITITLTGGPPIAVEIVDDGSGIPDDAVQKSQGGLSNLKRRARALGGDLRIESAASGSRVEIRLPQEA